MQPLNRNASRMQSAAVASDWGVGGRGVVGVFASSFVPSTLLSFKLSTVGLPSGPMGVSGMNRTRVADFFRHVRFLLRCGPVRSQRGRIASSATIQLEFA